MPPPTCRTLPLDRFSRVPQPAALLPPPPSRAPLRPMPRLPLFEAAEYQKHHFVRNRGDEAFTTKPSQPRLQLDETSPKKILPFSGQVFNPQER